MKIEVCKSKIHRAKVTHADLNYIGSITIDEDLMDASGLYEYEKVQIVNINNGERIETYVIKGERKTGVICLNGAAARKVCVGDLVIIIGYGTIDVKDIESHYPKVVFPCEKTNLIKKVGNKIDAFQKD